VEKYYKVQRIETYFVYAKSENDAIIGVMKNLKDPYIRGTFEVKEVEDGNS
jgi:hypothetical protein